MKRDDQTGNLKESVHGYPKNLLPRSVENIDDAFKILEQINGDPAQVMAARKKKLSNFRNLPKDEKNGAAVKK